MKTAGAGVNEIRVRDATGAYRVIPISSGYKLDSIDVRIGPAISSARRSLAAGRASGLCGALVVEGMQLKPECMCVCL
jgi:hypothetical protein